jgi:hypothetical protein
VFAWNADLNNTVRSKYIIIGEAAGVKLDDIWEDLSLEQRLTITKDLVPLEQKMLQYISIGQAMTQACPCPTTNGYLVMAICTMLAKLYRAPQQLKLLVRCQGTKDTVMRRFAISPIAERAYWNKERATINIDPGPCRYLSSLFS